MLQLSCPLMVLNNLLNPYYNYYIVSLSTNSIIIYIVSLAIILPTYCKVATLMAKPQEETNLEN